MGAAGITHVASASSAGADTGDPLVLGQQNTAANATVISTTEGEDVGEVHLGYGGLAAFAAIAESSNSGVLAAAGPGGLAGVEGHAGGSSGIGVAGFATEPGAIAMAALNQGAGPSLASQSDVDGVTLLLVPAERVGPPEEMPAGLTTYAIGSISLDEDGELWLCAASGAPGTWTRLLREDTAVGRTIPITPVRALDTRATSGRPPGSPVIPGQKKGPLKGGEAITLDLAGVSPIPASASGVLGNLTVVSPSYSGYLMAGPSGTTPTTSALNFTTGAIVANAFTSQLGPDGLTVRASGTASKTYELIVDLTAYIS